MKRLTAERFIAAAVNADEFSLRQNRELSEPELVVIYGGTSRTFLGPNLKMTSQPDYIVFLQALDEATGFRKYRFELGEIY